MRRTDSDSPKDTADSAGRSGSAARSEARRAGAGSGDRALGDFLRALRGRADPARLGVFDDGRPRRVPGLRREELAELAHVSVDYVVRIEQGRKRRVSRAVLTALADALDLDGDERLYLFAVAVAGTSPRDAAHPQDTPDDRVPDSVRRLLDGLPLLPALVLSRRMDVLAWNTAATWLLVDFGALPKEGRNLVRLAFLDPGYQALFGDGWEPMARESVAALRMEAGRRPEDTALQALVGELSVRDARFRAWWAAQSVSAPKLRRKTYHHPLAGPMTLDAQVYAVEGSPGLSLVGYSAPAGSPSEDALRFLAQWNSEGQERRP
ncbi:helix-turn-helix transcriptional regulator [Streptomyces sp. NPDC047002]|uniref:helix-turn-helix transcriptional regulator n=1 Tax=Streptomyces sp. NPDC047002 TaxID=3155475 RepID=UPI003451D7FB